VDSLRPIPTANRKDPLAPCAAGLFYLNEVLRDSKIGGIQILPYGV